MKIALLLCLSLHGVVVYGLENCRLVQIQGKIEKNKKDYYLNMNDKTLSEAKLKFHKNALAAVLNTENTFVKGKFIISSGKLNGAVIKNVLKLETAVPDPLFHRSTFKELKNNVKCL